MHGRVKHDRGNVLAFANGFCQRINVTVPGVDGICRDPVRDAGAERITGRSKPGQELIILAMVVAVELDHPVLAG